MNNHTIDYKQFALTVMLSSFVSTLFLFLNSARPRAILTVKLIALISIVLCAFLQHDAYASSGVKVMAVNMVALIDNDSQSAHELAGKERSDALHLVLDRQQHEASSSLVSVNDPEKQEKVPYEYAWLDELLGTTSDTQSSSSQESSYGTSPVAGSSPIAIPTTPKKAAALEIVCSLCEEAKTPNRLKCGHGICVACTPEKKISDDCPRCVQENSIQQCSICFDEFEADSEKSTLKCKHTYCSECINSWQRVGQSKDSEDRSAPDAKGCPICRADMEFVAGCCAICKDGRSDNYADVGFDCYNVQPHSISVPLWGKVPTFLPMRRWVSKLQFHEKCLRDTLDEKCDILENRGDSIFIHLPPSLSDQEDVYAFLELPIEFLDPTGNNGKTEVTAAVENAFTEALYTYKLSRKEREEQMRIEAERAIRLAITKKANYLRAEAKHSPTGFAIGLVKTLITGTNQIGCNCVSSAANL